MMLLTVEEKELLTRVATLMKELLETLDVIQDKEILADLKVALKEVEAGKSRPLSELVKELDLEAKV